MTLASDTLISTVETRALPNTVVFGFVKSLATELSRGAVELPSVPEVVIKLQRTLADENVSNETVVLVVGAEPMLAGKLMNMANSAALNTSGRGSPTCVPPWRASASISFVPPR